MASACVNNATESFIDISPAKCSSYSWLRISVNEESSKKVSPKKEATKTSNGETDLEDYVDFEFRLDDPVKMLPADELFSGGKLVPLHLTSARQSVVTTPDKVVLAEGVSADDDSEPRQPKEICSSTNPYLFSPKAPTCSIRWKELLGLKKLYQKQNTDRKMTSSSSCSRSIIRTSKSSPSPATDSCLSLPLLDSESTPLPSRFSLSSTSSSGREHDDVPRLSLDADKQQPRPATRGNSLSKARSSKHRKSFSTSETPKAASNRVISRSATKKEQQAAESTTTHDTSVDSPRMNASGRVVFHGLERSSSSPSSFNGGPTYKCRGVERSYSAHVRVAPVLNVPVCSLRGSSKFGFPLFASSSSQHKRDNSHHAGGVRRSQQVNK